MIPKISEAEATKFKLVQGGWQYRNREDRTILPPNTMVEGSQNVLTNTTGTVDSRKGYTLDGATTTVLAGIMASTDWLMHTGEERHLRAGFLSSTNDGKLQYRYVTSAGVVSWRDLESAQTSVNYNFTEYWDTSLVQSRLLWVNGDASITEWSGGVTEIASVCANTLTKSGTETWAEIGFYTSGSHTVVIAGISYGYTGGHGTTTLTGVTPNPATASPAISAGAIVHQLPESTANSAMTSLPTINNAIIGTLRNQVYIGALTNNTAYISKVNNYKDYSFATPRAVGEGALSVLEGPLRAFIPQEDRMYISAGKDLWYQTKFTLSADLTDEAFEVIRLKTGPLQATQSQGLTAKMKNNVIFVSNEVSINSLGRVENVFAEPNIEDLSFSIVNDIDESTFTNGQVIFWQELMLVSAPTDSKVFIFNMTNPENSYWEPPQLLPIGRFSIIDGELYGHSYQTSETYKLFDGYNDNGNFIESRVKFAFNSYADRGTLKNFNEMYVEGYISSNTTGTIEIQYDIDGCATDTEYDIEGSDTAIVCIGSGDNSLGKNPLGKEPLGSQILSNENTPPKFRVIQTFPRTPFYEYQFGFSSNGLDQQWSLLAFGPAVGPAQEQAISIKK